MDRNLQADLSDVGTIQTSERIPLKRQTLTGFSKLKVRSGRIGGMNFKQVLHLYIDRQYLVLKLMKLFWIGFKGIQVPLGKIKFKKSGRRLFNDYARFEIGGRDFEFWGDCRELIKKTKS